MKKQSPPNQSDNINSPFQNLGCLRILRGSILLACVKPWTVELLLSTGIHLSIPSSEAHKTGFKNTRSFTDALELGANFPNLKFTTRLMRDLRPRWVDAWGEHRPARKPFNPAPLGPAPDNTDAPSATENETADSKPSDSPQPPVSLPPPPVPVYFPYRSGGGGRSI